MSHTKTLEIKQSDKGKYMGTVYRQKTTRKLPADAEIVVRKGERVARWIDSKGKSRSAKVTTGNDGADRIVTVAATFTAKYRDGNDKPRIIATGCRDRQSALGVLADLERRAERVRGKILTTPEDMMLDHQRIPTVEHLRDYLASLEAAGTTEVYRIDTERLAKRMIEDLGIRKLSDLSASAVERWLMDRQRENMAARTRNSYLQALSGMLNWCIERGRIAVNPLDKVQRADQVSDSRRKRRAMTTDELRRLLSVASLRPLAEYGRKTVTLPSHERNGRSSWRKAELTFDNIEAAADRARERLATNPEFIAELVLAGRERVMMYKALVMTGLRQGELASLTIGQCRVDESAPYIELHAKDEKNREGALIPLRDDLAADLRQWIEAKRELSGGAAVLSIDAERDASKAFANQPLFNVPAKLVKILNRDLKAAGIAKHDERGRSLDVHALRHTFGTMLSAGGVAPRTAQAAMRHSKIDLTMNVYTDPKLLDVQGALDSLPALPLDGTASDHRQRATGTDGVQPSSLVTPLVTPVETLRCISGSTGVTLVDDDASSSHQQRVDARSAPVNRKDSQAITVCESWQRGGRDLNPQPPDRQSGTLTN